MVIGFLFSGELVPALEEWSGAAEVPVEFAGEVFEVGELFLRGFGGGDGFVGQGGAVVCGFVFQFGEIGTSEGELAGGIEEDAEVVGTVEDGADILGELADVGGVVAGFPEVAEAAEHGLDAESRWGFVVGGEIEIPEGGLGVVFEQGFHAGERPGGFAPGFEVAGRGGIADQGVEPGAGEVVFDGHHRAEGGSVADGEMKGGIVGETTGGDAVEMTEVRFFACEEAVADVGLGVGDQFLGGAIGGAVEAEGAGGDGARGVGGEKFAIRQEDFFDLGSEDGIEPVVGDGGFRERFPSGIGVGAEAADDTGGGCCGAAAFGVGAEGSKDIRLEDGTEVLAGAGVEVERPGGGCFGLEAAH